MLTKERERVAATCEALRLSPKSTAAIMEALDDGPAVPYTAPGGSLTLAPAMLPAFTFAELTTSAKFAALYAQGAAILQQVGGVMGNVADAQAALARLNERVTSLQDAIDTEQQQVGAVIGELQQQVAVLREQAGDSAELQAVVDGITAATDRLATAQADLASTIPDDVGPSGEEPVTEVGGTNG